MIPQFFSVHHKDEPNVKDGHKDITMLKTGLCLLASSLLERQGGGEVVFSQDNY